jgi:putative ABC transport system permease protein
MIAVQLALTIVLLTGAGLMVKSIWRMTSYPDGFAPDEILTLRIDFRGPGYRQPGPRGEFAQALLARAQALPGVRAAAIATFSEAIMLLMKEGEAAPPENRELRATPINIISPKFADVMGMTIVRGRALRSSSRCPSS